MTRKRDDDALLDFASDRIAQVRRECVEIGVRSGQIAALMMDDALLGWVAEGKNGSAAQRAFRDYANRRVPEWFKRFRRAAKAQDSTS